MTEKLTVAGAEYKASGGGHRAWSAPGQKSPYVFEADFGHKGVDLTHDEVVGITLEQMLQRAIEFNARWNAENLLSPFGLVGIDYLGPVEGTYYEEHGEDKGLLGDSKGRWHKFGGKGRAHLLRTDS